ncbi:MAG TPA: phosphatidate cytidylyltransferase [Eubacteriales bacterium]|nr:phosphatidate cytidylyltransferase [Eubacteriales bacterium]
MKTRVIVGSLLVLLLISVLYFGGFILLSVLSLFSIAAIYEMGLTFRKKGYNPIVIPAYVFAVGYSFVYFYFGLLSMIIFYMATVMATMIYSLFTKVHSTNDIIPSLFIMNYPTLFLMCMLLVYFSFDRPTALVAACMAYAAPECSDTFAYFGGTLLGKHKLCPTISPKKTVEGAAFALLGGIAFGFGVFYLQRLWGGTVQLSVLLPLGLGCGVLSQFGDLFASTLKRWAGVKDFSSIFPGHGGIIDRIDSIMFCTPLVLCVFVILRTLGTL